LGWNQRAQISPQQGGCCATPRTPARRRPAGCRGPHGCRSSTSQRTRPSTG
jgi:hypothetical protein